MAKKGTREQVEQRIEEVYGMMCDCYTTGQIVRYCAEQWGIKRRQAEGYIARCNERLETTHKESFEKIHKRAMDRTKRFYQRCMKAKQYPSMASALKELNELEGVKTQRIQLSGDAQNPVVVQISDDQLKDALKKAQDEC